MTQTAVFDVQGAVAAITATLEAHRDPAYERGMRRTVPSALPAHATRVPVIRKIAAEWRRAHRDASGEDVVDLAEALWQTGWREEMILAGMLLARSGPAMLVISWDRIERWSAQIENWEHVDNLAGDVTSRLLVSRPELLPRVEALAESLQPWQRRLALVTLIEAARMDARWKPNLASLAAKLHGDRGPTMRRAVIWAQKTVRDLEARSG